MDRAPGASAHDPREDAMAYAIIESLDVDKYWDVDKFREILSSVLTTRRTSPQTLIQVFHELNAMPHVAIKDPSTLTEGQIRDRIMMDELLEATKKARAKAREAFSRTPWARQHSNNFALVVDRRDDVEDDGSVIQDGCAICGVAKTECVKQDEHFGTRGESPPDAKCPHCSAGFGNSYNAEHHLQLHVALKHAATRQSPERNRFMVSPEPPASAGASSFASAGASSFASAGASSFASSFASFSERLVRVLTTRRTSPQTLIHVFHELNAMPHVAIPAPSTSGEGHIRDLILMDELLEATEKAHAKAKQAFERTPWARQHSNNCCALSDAAAVFKCDEDTVTPDGCAICGVVKTECVNQAEHFGTRGESPPDAKCPWCKMNLWNRYDSEYHLQLHVAARHGGRAPVSQTALCLLKTPPHMDRAHGAPAHDVVVISDDDSREDAPAHENTPEDVMAYAIAGSVDGRFSEIWSEMLGSPAAARKRMQRLGPDQQTMYSIMQKHFSAARHADRLHVHRAQDASGDASPDDVMAYAILWSLDSDRFREILSEPASYDAKERLQRYGPQNRLMYSLMETHFKQGAAQGAAPPPSNPEQAGASDSDEVPARRRRANSIMKVPEHASDSDERPARRARLRSVSASDEDGLSAGAAGEKTSRDIGGKTKAAWKNPARMKTFRPSPALTERLEHIIDAMLALQGADAAFDQRLIQTALEEHTAEHREYDGWRRARKYKDSFERFLVQMGTDISQAHEAKVAAGRGQARLGDGAEISKRVPEIGTELGALTRFLSDDEDAFHPREPEIRNWFERTGRTHRFDFVQFEDLDPKTRKGLMAVSSRVALGVLDEAKVRERTGSNVRSMEEFAERILDILDDLDDDDDDDDDDDA